MQVLNEIDAALRALSSRLGNESGIDAGTVLGARAGLRASSRQGRTSVAGFTRLLKARDGWVAVSLAREDDLQSVEAMFDSVTRGDPWTRLGAAAAQHSTREFVERVQLFGVPAARVPDVVPEIRVPWRVGTIAAALPVATLTDAVVVDLSSLWAGPLCGHLLGRAGARVIKVESIRRPDGARAGEPRFYDWLHAGQESVGVDFRFAEDRAAVAELIRSADVVIEASRPRALKQLGLSHDDVDLKAGAVWVSITGHGRDRPELVAFGDDAAAAGGLVASADGSPLFCGDAIADPLTGVTAALAAMASLSLGGGHLIDLAMADVAAAFAGAPLGCTAEHHVDLRRKSWFVTCTASGQEQRVLRPRVPESTGSAPRIGADNTTWLRLLTA